MKNLIARFIREEEGQDLAEYGLLVALVALIVLAGVTLFGANLLTFFNDLAGTVAGW
jgi:pilus assembly protein Flp/PilA